LDVAISNIRQRIEALESSTGVIASTVGQQLSASNTQFGTLLSLINALTARVLALENAAGIDAGKFVAGEVITAGQGVVAISPNTVGVANPSLPARAGALIGVATNNASPGGSVTVQRRGFYAVPGATGFVVGRVVYIDPLGLTQNPSYDHTAVPMGIAVSASSIFIAPDFPALYLEGFDPGYEDFLPASYGLVKRLLGSAHGGDSVLYDNEGRAALTSDGRAILTA
jgi:predicted RecA/RadA family phage recombinase